MRCGVRQLLADRRISAATHRRQREEGSQGRAERQHISMPLFPDMRRALQKPPRAQPGLQSRRCVDIVAADVGGTMFDIMANIERVHEIVQQCEVLGDRKFVG